jgi:hypothetical protein
VLPATHFTFAPFQTTVMPSGFRVWFAQNGVHRANVSLKQSRRAILGIHATDLHVVFLCQGKNELNFRLAVAASSIILSCFLYYIFSHLLRRSNRHFSRYRYITQHMNVISTPAVEQCFSKCGPSCQPDGS